jgi:hypothetical protein
MNAARAQAYGRITRTIDEIGPVKLLPPESELIREIADTLLFCGDQYGEEASIAAVEAEALAGHLEESGRWTPGRARELHADLLACGPSTPSELPHAA